MQVTPMCRALALHDIFDAHGVKAGGGLPLTTVAQAWSASGLRRADLDEALAEARVTGEFVTVAGGDGSRVVLTERGFEQSQRDLSSLSQIEELIHAYAVLGLTRQRQPLGPAFGRRRADKLDS